MTELKVKTGEFEGPIEMLLELIEERKLNINDISLSEVADNFIEQVKKMEGLPLEITANFIVVASTLLLIKSRSLLPSLELSAEEEQSIDELKNRLAIYQDIKHKSKYVSALFGKTMIFEREQPKEIVSVFSPAGDLSIKNILGTIQGVIRNLPKKEFMPQAIVKKVISLEEVIGNLAERVKRSLKMRFSEFSGKGKSDKVTVIVSFLAMLELVKQGAILVRQHAHFSDIEMEATEPSAIPNYS